MSTVFEIFWRFLGLGCISFGGPVAHLGYFRHQFVEKLKWLDDERYANLIALSQFLPGPGSSQTGFAIGYNRAGIPGGIAAFLGFTLPSFFLMWAFANAQNFLQDNASFAGLIHGLKILAVVVVADACYKMFSKFCTTRATQLLCFLSLCLLLLVPALHTQIFVLVGAALCGIILKDFFKPKSLVEKTKQSLSFLTSEKIALGLFFIILLSSPLWKSATNFTQLFGDFYQAGSLVFGGGHVVLPLLQDFVGHQMTQEQFLAGYAGAQAVPGPMFSLASYLGAVLEADQGLTGSLLGSLIACAGIFLPGYLLVIALFNNWERLAARPFFASAITAINAAVVGLLLSALYQPVFVSAIEQGQHLALAIVGWAALRLFSVHIVFLVIAYAALGFVLL